MPLDLSSVEAKLERAIEHHKALNNEIRPWLESNPYIITKEINSDFTHHGIVAHLVGSKPAIRRWRVMMSDCISNLRACLDHLVYAIAVHELGESLPSPKIERLAFPICDSPSKFTNAGYRIDVLSAPVKATIETVQPYRRKHPRVPPPLAILRDINNRDKHRLLNMAAFATLRGDYEISGFQNPPLIPPKIFRNDGEVEDGAEIVAFTFNVPNPNMKCTADFELAIMLWHDKRDVDGPSGSGRSEFSALITLMTDEVRFVIDTLVAAVNK